MSGYSDQTVIPISNHSHFNPYDYHNNAELPIFIFILNVLLHTDFRNKWYYEMYHAKWRSRHVLRPNKTREDKNIDAQISVVQSVVRNGFKDQCYTGKGKGSRRLRLPDFNTIGT
jgi:hypothetical protein